MIPLAPFLAASLAFAPADAKAARDVACALVENHTPRDSGTLQGRLAAYFIYDSVRRSGLDARLDNFLAQTPEGQLKFSNVVCDIKSDPADPWIVLVSHYDTKRGTECPGANDGASTSGLLVSLARILAKNRFDGMNIRLLWTDGEECFDAYGPGDGLWGSRRAAKEMKSAGMDVRAAICLDMLGDRDLAICVPRNGTRRLREMAFAAAESVGVSGYVVDCPEKVNDDHVPFLEEGFAAIDLIDFEYGSGPGLNDYWHTEQDSPDKISEESLQVSGRLVCGLLAALHEECRRRDSNPYGR